MSEIVEYRDEWTEKLRQTGKLQTGCSALSPALHKLDYRVFASSTATAITHGLDQYSRPDPHVTGLSGIYSPGTTAKISWTVRWDWDADKGVHVNLIMRTAQGTKRYAFTEMRKDELVARRRALHINRQIPTPEKYSQFYWPTIQRLTQDCQWSKAYHDSLPAARRAAYKVDCAKNGHSVWVSRIMGR